MLRAHSEQDQTSRIGDTLIRKRILIQHIQINVYLHYVEKEIFMIQKYKTNTGGRDSNPQQLFWRQPFYQLNYPPINYTKSEKKPPYFPFQIKQYIRDLTIFTKYYF